MFVQGAKFNGLKILYFSRQCVISGFRCCIGEICDIIVYYAAYSGNYLPTFQVNL
jgi:hypothetical protein